jgi:hypothetical protein
MEPMLEVVLALVPLLLLLSALLLGHYPGVDAIVRLSARFGARRRERSTAKQPRPRAPHFRAVKGGLLIALGLAQRPPPLRS